METPDLIQFIKDTKGDAPWDVSSVIRVAVALYLRVQLFSNLSKEQKALLVCNLVKKILEVEKAELDKKIGLTEDQKKIEVTVFEKVLHAVDEFLPSVLEHMPVPEMPKAFTRWFSFIPCSMISVGLHASEELVSLANLKKVEAVLDKVAEAVPAAAPLVSKVAEVAAVAAVVVEVSPTVTQTVDETKKEQEQEQQNGEDKA